MPHFTPDSFRNCHLGLLLGRAALLKDRIIDTHMEPHGVTAAQFKVLIIMAQFGVDTPAELCRNLSLDSGSMTRMLDRLEAKGLLVRERSCSDRRVVNLSLTPRGSEVAAQIPHVLSEVLNDHLRGFSPKEFDQLLDLLRRFIANGEALAEANKAAPGPQLVVQERDPEENNDNNPS